VAVLAVAAQALVAQQVSLEFQEQQIPAVAVVEAVTSVVFIAEAETVALVLLQFVS
jgi:uridine phosphorylase